MVDGAVGQNIHLVQSRVVMDRRNVKELAQIPTQGEVGRYVKEDWKK